MKRALITGSTDGIGKATAIALAKKGYEIHVLGRNKLKGEAVLKTLKEINDKANHKLYLVDLMDIKENINFIDQYLEENHRLDNLILNANPMPMKEKNISSTGYDSAFMVGFISRYIFSIKLEPLLKMTPDSRVTHITDTTIFRKINFSKLNNPSYGAMTSIGYAYTANGHFFRHITANKLTHVTHELMSPGSVNTNQIKDAGKLVYFIAKLYDLMEPEEVGEILANHLTTTNTKNSYGKSFKREKEIAISPKYDTKETIDELLKIAEIETGIGIDQLNKSI